MKSHGASRESKKAKPPKRSAGLRGAAGRSARTRHGLKDGGSKTEPVARAESVAARPKHKPSQGGRARQAGHPRRTPFEGPQLDIGSAFNRVGPGDGNPLLKAAGRFHGHIGAFLAIGMRMGLVANEEIGRDPFGVVADVTVEARPPRSCLVDGVQYATGCTMGKGNIRITPRSDRISARFSRGERRITVTLKRALLRRLERDLEGKPEKAIIDYAFGIMDTPAGDLFEVTE